MIRGLALGWWAISIWTCLGAAPGLVPNLDRRQPLAADLLVSPDRQRAVDRLMSEYPEAQVQFEPITGGPTLLMRRSRPGSSAPAFGLAASRGNPNLSQGRHVALRALLDAQRGLFGYGAEVLTNAVLYREHATARTGARTVAWQQQFSGIPIYEARLVARLDPAGDVVNVSSQFVPEAAVAAAAGTPGWDLLQARPPISAQEALSRAAFDLGLRAEPNNFSLVRAPFALDAARRQTYRSTGWSGESEVSLTWFPLSPSVLKLGWRVYLVSRASAAAVELVIDAVSGEVLRRRPMSADVGDASYLVFAGDSPTPLSPGRSVSNIVAQPELAPRVQIAESAVRNALASPQGWIDDGLNETRGRNVDAFLDRDANGSPDRPRPTGAPVRVFRPPLDLSTVPPPDPRLYWDASVVNLFYWCNWMHDRLYELGFTRAAGNLEGPDNFLLAQAQFGADATQMISDAARLQYAPEGQHCRLFTSLWSGPNPDRDSAFDTEIILHEYAHALTFRSIGGGAGPRDARSQYMGMCEGWSDFYALALLAESTDDLNGHYPFAAYSTYQWYGEDFENYYFGLRAYPYARDMKHDPRTFRDIDRVKAVGHPGIPIHPIWEPFPPGELAQQAHHKGGVWCSVLWDARANLIDKLGFSWGNGRMLQLVTDGVMALSMSSPTFLQARDAILDADAGVNGKELWAAFYKRGLGGGAKDLSTSEATASVLESFNRADFDLDGRPDLLLQNAAGLVKVWHMDGRTNQSESVIGQLGGSWRVVATADINHDGRADLFLQDNSSSVGYRLLDGTNIIGSGTVMPSLPDPTTWQVVGTGDFDQDSNPDLLWQDPRGGLAVWYMDGTKQRTTSRLDPIGTFDPNWRVVATGDFNQDGQIDILFQHSSTMLAVWYMNGIHRLQSVLLQPAYSRGAWRAFAVEDYNGDGYPDILFQEKGTLDGGNLAIWFLKGLQEAGARLLVPSPNPGVDFNLVGPR